MKHHSIPIYLFLFLCLPLLAHGGSQVRFVYDGDTILLENGRRIRYLGIDTPERGSEEAPPEFLAEAAKAFNQKAVRGVSLRLEFDRQRKDHHGRWLAYVYLPDGRMLNEELLREGLARVLAVPPNLEQFERLVEAQREAMARRAGIWARVTEAGEGPFVGSRRSHRFHRPDCPYGRRIHLENRVRFETRWRAFWEGYSPCSGCLPRPGRSRSGQSP
jgi:endonuclease YncB( thermonuclease family)